MTDIEIELLAAFERGCASRDAEIERLKSGAVCGDCDGSGWLENREDGRIPCGCMTEAEPYQLLQEQVTLLRDVIGNIKNYAHKTDDVLRWCDEAIAATEPKP